MAGKSSGNKKGSTDKATEEFSAGFGIVSEHPLFGRLLWHTTVYRGQIKNENHFAKDGWAFIGSDGSIHCHPKRRGERNQWAYVLAHCLLHRAMDHFQKQAFHREWNAACCAYVTKFLQDLKFGEAPDQMAGIIELTSKTEDALYKQFCKSGIPPLLDGLGTAGATTADIQCTLEYGQWSKHFAYAIADATAHAVDVAGGAYSNSRLSKEDSASLAQRCRRWFINHFPLLGALAASFEIVEDPNICYREHISIAAVNPELREIYVNSARLSEEECRFVMAHEFLHVGLRHETRAQGRDAYLWNVACDYVINGWLIEMGIGTPPAGILIDEELKGLNAEAIYDRIVTDMRRYRKLMTLRGSCAGEHGDIMKERRAGWWGSGEGIDLDEFYRRALAEGLALHENQGRGYLPLGLVEAVRALMQPPIRWDVELAHWFDRHFPPLEKTRTFARASRRQSSTPDIPRPRYVPTIPEETRTFGVVLDTSGSMDRNLLAKALGSIASYAIARDVSMVRVVFCDADAYDQGYMAPEEIAGRVKVKGRGGTVLQPGIDLLQKSRDFPERGPLLIITDGFCDVLKVRRDHAFLIPHNSMLPFPPVGQVFRMR